MLTGVNNNIKSKKKKLKRGVYALALTSILSSSIILSGCGNSDKTVETEDKEIETSNENIYDLEDTLNDYEIIEEVDSDEIESVEIGNYLDISTVQDMEDFSAEVAKGRSFAGYTVRLMNDLEYDGTPGNFKTIGAFNKYFEGTFDGQNHTISGIYLMPIDNQDVAMFNVLQNATVKNLFLEDCKATGNVNNVNMIATYLRNSTLENVHIIGGEIKNTFSNAAGLSSSAHDSVIRNCSNTALISGDSWIFISGLVGTMTDSKIINCFNGGDVISTSEVRGQSNTTAGICYSGSGSIINCYNTGKATYGITSQATNVINCFSAREQSEDYFGTGEIIEDCEIINLSEMSSGDFLKKLNDYASKNKEYKSFSLESGYDYPVIR